jgi:hypothetical protein
MEESEDSTGFGWIAGLVLILVVLIFLGYFYAKIEGVRRAKEDVELCRKTVDLSALSHVKGFNLIDTLDCPAVEVTIKDGNEDTIKKKVASEMADCWYKFGEGDKELFDRLWISSDTFCAVCSYVEFEGSAKDKQVTGFIEYLNTHKVKTMYGRKSYIEFLNTMTPADIEKSYGQGTIDTSKDYDVIFVYTKGAMFDKVTGALTGGAIGAGGTVIITGLLAAPEPIITKAAVVVALAGAAVGAYAGDSASSQWGAMTILTPHEEGTFDKLECEKLPIAQRSRDR